MFRILDILFQILMNARKTLASVLMMRAVPTLMEALSVSVDLASWVMENQLELDALVKVDFLQHFANCLASKVKTVTLDSCTMEWISYDHYQRNLVMFRVNVAIEAACWMETELARLQESRKIFFFSVCSSSSWIKRFVHPCIATLLETELIL